MFIDFGLLKESVTILEVAKMLELPLKPNGDTSRCPCPVCEKEGRSLAITASKNTFYCFKARTGGDIIALVSHVKQIPMRDAAHFIVTSTESEASTNGMQPLDYLDWIDDNVQSLGISPETAQAIGIGYARKGIMRGRIAFPIRLPNGALLGYIGVAPDADVKLPKNLSVKP